MINWTSKRDHGIKITGTHSENGEVKHTIFIQKVRCKRMRYRTYWGSFTQTYIEDARSGEKVYESIEPETLSDAKSFVERMLTTDQ